MECPLLLSPTAQQLRHTKTLHEQGHTATSTVVRDALCQGACKIEDPLAIDLTRATYSDPARKYVDFVVFNFSSNKDSPDLKVLLSHCLSTQSHQKCGIYFIVGRAFILFVCTKPVSYAQSAILSDMFPLRYIYIYI